MIEILKQMVEALKLSAISIDNFGVQKKSQEAIQAGKQLIAELESQEPVAHCTVRPLRGDESYSKTEILWVKGKPIAGPLYSHPQRTWVGLIDKDMNEPKTHIFDFIAGARWAESILKERNT